MGTQVSYKKKECRVKTFCASLNFSGKLDSLEEFRAQREELTQKSKDMEEQLKTQEQNHKEQIYQLERKAVIDKDRYPNFFTTLIIISDHRTVYRICRFFCLREIAIS